MVHDASRCGEYKTINPDCSSVIVNIFDSDIKPRTCSACQLCDRQHTGKKLDEGRIMTCRFPLIQNTYSHHPSKRQAEAAADIK
ncbi:hypothetical protein V6N11_002545 [Hibiscus sabdariffa]|uniref:Uncharacterized protein n=1 Tax=Hibiscus sabdariffa TaxID=183260 RepID=A0ABR2SAZ2_9ROSI